GSLVSAYIAFLVAALGASISCGIQLIRLQIRCTPRDIAGYGAVWRLQSKWALVGVASTEATANSHAWLVTFTAGPASFAPIAAAALLFRPVGLCAMALTQLERPLLAKHTSKGD